jgi:RimJ/RimL family protein N-acetyltransferase
MMAKTWETERLVIRRFRGEDWEDLYALQGDPEATKFVGGVWTAEKTREVLGMIVGRYEKRELEWFAVEEKESGRVMGACWLGPLNARWGEALGVGEQVELGYRYARAYWGKGYATEAGRVMLRRGFEELGLERVVAIVNVLNVASERVIRKLGMEYVSEAEREGMRVRCYSAGRGS